MSDSTQKNGEGSACGCGGGSCCTLTGKWIWPVLALAVAVVLLARYSTDRKKETSVTPVVAQSVSVDKALPRLVDLGAGKCIPCKMMAPILEDLKKAYAGKLDVEFIDVWENRDAGSKYGINVIPTQIFYNAQGKELFRHEGFFSKEDILAKWSEFGVALDGTSK